MRRPSLAPGQWAFDAATNRLFVRMLQDEDPSSFFGSPPLEALDPTRLARIPNNDQGWGRLNISNTLLQSPATDRGPGIYSDQKQAFTASGQEFRINVAPVDTARTLRITLAWTDAAAAVGSTLTIVNNLNLEVIELATGAVYMGNWFANGFSQANGLSDLRNNVECVFVRNPSGTYEVRVIATFLSASANPTITTPWQDFALVIDNADVPAGSPVNVATVIDRSGSMIAYGYVDITRVCSRQFVDLMHVGDAVGVVSFGSTADVAYPAGGGSRADHRAADQGCRDERDRCDRVRRVHVHGRRNRRRGGAPLGVAIAAGAGPAVGRLRQQGVRCRQCGQADGASGRERAARGRPPVLLRDGPLVRPGAARIACRGDRRPLLLRADDRRPVRDLQLHPRPGQRRFDRGQSERNSIVQRRAGVRR